MARKIKNARALNSSFDAFAYFNYHEFLRDYFSRFGAPTLKSISAKAGITLGYLSMIVSGKKPLSRKAFEKIASHLSLSDAELDYFEALVDLGNTSEHSARMRAFEKIKRHWNYRKKHPADAAAFEYLDNWYFIAIREMADLKDFKFDPKWIQNRLKYKVEPSEVKRAMQFLLDHGYIEKKKDGTYQASPQNVDCIEGVYRLALSQFHRNMFQMAGQAIDTYGHDERFIKGQTVSIESKDYNEAVKVIEEAVEKLKALNSRSKNADTVYQMELALFPLAGGKEK